MIQSPDRYYFNLTFFNNSNENSSLPQDVPASITETYDRDIIKNPSEWNVAIARFSISSNFVGRVYQPYPTTTSTTKFFVGLSYNNIFYDIPIVLPIVTQQDGTKQQLVYNTNDFLDLLNQAFVTAQSSVTSAGGPTGNGTTIITFDNVSGFYDVNIPTYYGITGGIDVTMSYELYHRFQGFSVTQNSPLLYNGHDITFIKKSRGNNIDVIENPLGITGTYYICKQDAKWSSSITDITRLLITTNSIPIAQEFRGQQLYTQFSGNQSNDTIGILTDVLIGQDEELIARAEHWIYVPPFLRLVSMIGNNVLRTLNINVYIADVFGSVFRLYLGPLDNMDIKLIFLKKGLES